MLLLTSHGAHKEDVSVSTEGSTEAARRSTWLLSQAISPTRMHA